MALPSNAYGSQLGTPIFGPIRPGPTALSCPTNDSCAAVGSYQIKPIYSNTYAGVTFSETTTPPQASLTLSVTNGGMGTIASSPAGIDCGSTCATSYTLGSEVTLTATTDPLTSVFWQPPGWAGCTKSGTQLDVPMNTDVTVGACFSPLQYAVNAQIAGTGTGTITSTPSGISCGQTCSHPFTHGTQMTLSATPEPASGGNPGSTFAGWSGGGCSGTDPCVFTLGSDTTVTATFVKNPIVPHDVTVEFAGSGTGFVTSAPSGIDCVATCSKSFPYGTQVTLYASAEPASGTNPGSTFAGWSGGACSGAVTCNLTLGSDATVTATFVKNPPKCLVPKVARDRLETAKRAVVAAHCAVGAISRATSKRVKKGRVISQKPRAGGVYRRGKKINLLVSTGR